MFRLSIVAFAVVGISALPAAAFQSPGAIEVAAPDSANLPTRAPRKRPEKRDTCVRQSGLPAVHGRGGNDRLYGGAAAYQMFGDEDRDFLLGGSGDDELNGGDEADTLIGGGGADLFAYDTEFASTADKKGQWSPESGDTIVDFQAEERDKIDLTRTQKYGASAPANFQWSDRAAEPYSVWTLPRDGDTVLAVDLDGDAQADMAVRLLGELHLTPSNFCGVEPDPS